MDKRCYYSYNKLDNCDIKKCRIHSRMNWKRCDYGKRVADKFKRAEDKKENTAWKLLKEVADILDGATEKGLNIHHSDIKHRIIEAIKGALSNG